MGKITDVTVKDVALYFLPIKTRLPLKFGKALVTHATCARCQLRVEDASGRSAQGWGETPLGVDWSWPSSLSYTKRLPVFEDFCIRAAGAWKNFDCTGHPIEIGHAFQQEVLPGLLQQYQPMPRLAALVCLSAFDIALHDAFGVLHQQPIYATYNREFMNSDLSAYLSPAEGSVSFSGRYPEDYLAKPAPRRLPAWHLVGGTDLLTESELTGAEPKDGYPVLLTEWIAEDGLQCLKIKLRGNDPEWDYNRLVQVGTIGGEHGVLWLSADFNCTVDEPAYVNAGLDRLLTEHPRIYSMILYVEQPFPYDLETNQIDVHGVSARKPLFMDESAHDWRLVRLGRSLGWTGVALKTCKTQTGALFSLCWAKAHGMTLMVQDLTNPMLAMIPHLELAAHAGTIMGVETNAMQFYPEASLAEATVHPGLYQRREGPLDLSTLGGRGFGYRVDEIKRILPDPVFGEN